MNSLRKIIVGSALTGAAVIGGAIAAGSIGSANAASGTGSGSSGSTATTAASTAGSTTASSTPAQPAAPSGQPAGQPQQAPDWSKGGHTANGITETLLTGDDLTKATAAAEAAEPGATVQRAETDAEGAAFEVHMTKADGSIVTVKLDSSFNVTSTINGMG